MLNRASSLAQSRLACLALLICLSSLPAALAIDLDLPAQVRIHVVDDKDQPLPKASVTLKPALGSADEEEAGIQRTIDGSGTLLVTLPRPADWPASRVQWAYRVIAACRNFHSQKVWLTLFPDARIEKTIGLLPKKTTVIRVCGPDGRPLPGVDLAIGYHIRGRTDERGEYVCEPVPLTGSRLWVSIAGRSHPVEVGSAATIRLDKQDLRQAPRNRRLAGRLLMADGTPARGWSVAKGSRHAMGCGSKYGSTDGYDAAEIAPVDAAGRFTLDRPDDHLLIVSPHGIPFLYPLAPNCWPDAERRVSLRAPPVRRVHRARLMYEDGKPAADRRIFASSVRFNSRRFYLRVGNWFGETVALSQAASPDRNRIESFTTDRQGRYSLPVHFGAQVDFGVKTKYGDCYPSLLSGDDVILRTLYSDQRPQYKRITLDFRQDDGEPIPEMWLTHCRGQSAGEPVPSAGSNRYADTRGVHLFLEARVDRIEIRTSSRSWNRLCKWLDIPGPQDRAVTITVPEKLRRRPLMGRILDPDGRPVAGVSVSLYDVQPHLVGHPNYLGFNATTDSRGRFAYDAAPDNCLIQLYRYTDDGNAWNLPGWTNPLPVSRQEREITVRLRQAGSVRITVPADPVVKACRFSLARTRPQKVHPHPRRSHSLVSDPEVPGSFLARYVAPGRYKLRTGLARTEYDLMAIESLAVHVVAGETTTVDLRDRALFPPRALPAVRLGILVQYGGKPVSGATVKVFPAGLLDGETRAMLQRSRMGGWISVSADLSDDTGRSGFRALVGERYIAVARVHGSLIGWRGFSASKETDITIDMRPAKTLVVRLSEVKAPRHRSDSRSVWLRLRAVPADEALVLFHALDLPTLGSPGQPIGRFRSDGPLAFVAEDLPASVPFTLQVRDWGEKVLVEREALLARDGPSVREELIETE